MTQQQEQEAPIKKVASEDWEPEELVVAEAAFVGPMGSAQADTVEEWAAMTAFTEEQRRLVQFREEQKTKRLWLVLAVVALLVALVILTFAPPGRETLSYWIGGALLIFAAGAAGYKRVWGKSKLFSVGADQDKRDLG